MTKDNEKRHERESKGETTNTMKQAGYINSDGYRIITINGREYFAHDLAWLDMTGEFPKGEVEHINGNNNDDRWCNLRLKAATYSDH